MVEPQTIQPSQNSKIGNPFPGLRPFNTDESLVFFGRDGQSDMLLEKLWDTRFVAVVGTSGSGKSSLVRAGLLPALRGGFMNDAGSGWHIAMFRPINDPIGNLARALLKSNIFARGGSESASERLQIIEETLRHSSLGLIEVARRAQLSPFDNLLIVADQFEELYRFEPSSKVENPKDEASAFIKLLLEVTRQQEIPIFIILTMRSDYLGESARFWGLPEAINRGQFLIPRMDDDERREAIEGPVRVRGGRISWALVNRLLNDAGDDPQRLPILQHAMMRTWDYWEKHRNESEPIGIDHYINPGVGGMEGALSLHAEEAYGELSDNQKVIAEKMFKRLTEKSAGKRESRFSATMGEIEKVAETKKGELLPVIKAFRKEGRSFLMPPGPTALKADTVLDISHESLISGWTRLSKWVEGEADSAKTYGRLVDDALRYPEHARLLTNPELQSTLLWGEREQPNEAWAKRYWTDFGKALAGDNPPARPRWAKTDDSEFGIAMRYLELSKSARNRRTILTTLAIAATALLLFGLGVFEYSRALAQAKESKVAADRALIGEEEAKKARVEADKSKIRAEELQQQADEAAKTANTQRDRADAALVVAEKQRRLAEQRGKQLSDFAELGKANDRVLAAIWLGSTDEIVDAYQSMRKVYERPGFQKPVNQDTLDDLTVEAIFRDNDRNVSEAFAYFNQKYMRSSRKEPNSLIHAKIAFAQRIIQSGQRGNEEAVEFLIEHLDDAKAGVEKATALVRLGDISGSSAAAIKAFSEAVRLFHSTNEAAEEAKAREKLGDTYLKMNDYLEARTQYDEALKLFVGMNDQTGAARIRKQIQLLDRPPSDRP